MRRTPASQIIQQRRPRTVRRIQTQTHYSKTGRAMQAKIIVLSQ
ncbi:hypothetical protein CLOSTMETH_00978 [[Clostridium] methylpentosum DSM 5476]|uniref:Uncharacterized protein n=1 Tax=[Clostridium] methylpentosum DSM 5476 TaxID=537013 RepID=C0EAW1_9FIRM|nr:hypothetical protein CLOSTMETH_00978 [[Clostridium] methylpentosum DSM 5476]